LFQLQPVTFAYKDDSKGTTDYGLIAEQVATV
jgi:Chaperone of endosialidase